MLRQDLQNNIMTVVIKILNSIAALNVFQWLQIEGLERQLNSNLPFDKCQSEAST